VKKEGYVHVAGTIRSVSCRPARRRWEPKEGFFRRLRLPEAQSSVVHDPVDAQPCPSRSGPFEEGVTKAQETIKRGQAVGDNITQIWPGSFAEAYVDREYPENAVSLAAIGETSATLGNIRNPHSRKLQDTELAVSAAVDVETAGDLYHADPDPSPAQGEWIKEMPPGHRHLSSAAGYFQKTLASMTISPQFAEETSHGSKTMSGGTDVNRSNTAGAVVSQLLTVRLAEAVASRGVSFANSSRFSSKRARRSRIQRQKALCHHTWLFAAENAI
jgi:hypothetical protein